MYALRKAWRKPPNGLHRWIATHQLLYVALVIGVLIVSVRGFLASFDRWTLLALGGVAIFGLAAYLGAVIARRRVEQYDARAKE